MSSICGSGRVASARSKWLEVLGPARCAGCGDRLGPLCASCRMEIPGLIDRPPPPPVRRLVCPWPYEGAVRSLVLGLKVRAVRSYAAPLVEAMTSDVWRHGLSAPTITWVPGRRAEERRRGFDHAHVLAGGLGRMLGLPVRRLLERTGSDRDQVGLSAEERRVNLEGAFHPVREPSGRIWRRNVRFPNYLPQGSGVALVDDVLTTGATASACARALLEGGAGFVELVVACGAE